MVDNKFARTLRKYAEEVGIDLCSYIGLGIAIFLGLFLLKLNLAGVADVLPTLNKLGIVLGGNMLDQLTDSFARELGKTADKMFWIIVNSIIIVILTLLLSIILTTIPKGYLWSRIKTKKYSRKFLIKYPLLKLLWVIIWLIPVALLIYIFKENIAAYMIITASVLFLHFTIVQSAIFNEKEKILSLIKKTFIAGTKKIHTIFLSYFIFAILLIAIYIIIGSIVKILPIATTPILLVIFIIIILTLIAWLRNLVYQSLKTK